MLSCDKFRFHAGADPEHLPCASRLHRLLCIGCARYLRDMRRFNRRIREALKVNAAGRDQPR